MKRNKASIQIRAPPTQRGLIWPLDSLARLLLRPSRLNGLARRKRGIPPPIGIDQPDYLCFVGYAFSVLKWLYDTRPEAEQVHFVVEAKRGVTENIATFHGEMNRILKPGLASLVGELIPGRKEAFLPLQAADVFCWHQQRRQAEHANRADQKRLARLGSTFGSPHEWTAEDLNHFVKEWFR